MVRRSTRKAQLAQSAPVHEDVGESVKGPPQVAKALFADVMEGSTNRVVDPRNCIVLTNIREIVPSGVQRMKVLFRGHVDNSVIPEASQNHGCNSGVIAGSDNPIVIPLTGIYKRYVIDYFKSEGLTETEARERIGTNTAWYGVVDGMHRLLAIRELSKEEPEIWSGFSWPVTVLKGGHDIQTLKQLGRHQNFKHSTSHFIETTLFDTLRGLREEATRLTAERAGKPPTGLEIAMAFDGNAQNKTSTRKQTATLAVRFAPEVVEAIGKIMNSEHPDLVSRTDCGLSAKISKRTNLEDILKAVDCRLFRNFVNITSLKSASNFMHADGPDGVACQVNTLYRIRESCSLNRFKPVSFRIVSEQFEKASSAMRESKKFEELLETDKWPQEMQIVRNNLLQTTKFDADVTVNKGNEFSVLPTILEAYRRLYPETATFKEAKYKASHLTVNNQPEHGESLDTDTSPVILDCETSLAKSGSHGDPTGKPSDASCAEGAGASSDQNRISSEFGAGGMDSQASERLQISSHGIVGKDYLAELRIDCHQMTWQEYVKTMVSDSSELFDMVLSDPPYGTPQSSSGAGTGYENFVAKQEMDELAQYCRKALKPGGWLLLFTSLQYFNDWRAAFCAMGFTSPGYSFVVMKDTSTVQGNRSAYFPQNVCEHILFARAPGNRNDGFKTDRTSPYHTLSTKQKRRFAAISDVPVTEKKLLKPGTKAPILVEEKNPKLLAELMTTFCPDGGRVVDFYSGTMSTAIACMMTNRPCVCIEANANTYRLARSRLARLAQVFSMSSDGSQTKKLRPSPTSRLSTLNSISKLPMIAEASISRDIDSITHAARDEGPKKNSTYVEKPDSALHEAGVRSSYNEEESQDQTKSLVADTNDPEQKKSLSKSVQCCDPKTPLFMKDKTMDKRVPEEAQQERLAPGDEVSLLVGDATVGSACLQCQYETGAGIVTTLHGHSLNTSESKKNGWHLVTVLRVQIEKQYRSMKYPYNYRGQEAPPETLSGMGLGCHAWDMREMRKKE